MQNTAITGATIFTGEAVLNQHTLLIKNGFIVAIQPNHLPVPEGYERLDRSGKMLSAGLIDAQVYGGGGALFSTHPTLDTLENLYTFNRRHGTVGVYPTLPTQSEAMMIQAIEAVRQFQSKYPDALLGLHLEGPFLNAEKKGAHPADLIQQPTAEKLRHWFELGQGALKIMTLAPECLTDDIGNLAEQYGVVLSAGHSNATYQQAMAAFDGPFSMATHLFNAMSPLGHRAPGLVGAAFDHASARASIIADGVHVDFAAVRIAKQVMGRRLFLITDAVDDSGAEPYRFYKKDDHYVNGDGILSGSALTMPQAVINCVNHGVCDLHEAIRMASLYPAQALGIDDRFGRIAVGYSGVLCEWADYSNSASIVKA